MNTTYDKTEIITAIMVDGAFYLRHAQSMWGMKSPMDRANELIEYCRRHLKDDYEKRNLYRLFYYDCPPSSKKVYHPMLKKQVDLAKSETFAWMTEFQEELRKKRKVALRLGKLSEIDLHYVLRPEAVKKLCNGKLDVAHLQESDFKLTITQKGVDTRIGLDIASLAYKRLVKQVILISGDSDFVPIAKVARREGIDFILDPMWSTIKPELFEHIDGLRSPCQRPQFGRTSEE